MGSVNSFFAKDKQNNTPATYSNQVYKPPSVCFDDFNMARVLKEDRVIIPVDRGKESLRAFNWYLENLHHKGNQIHLVHCCEVDQPSGADYPDYAIPPEQWNETLDKCKESGNNVLDPYRKLLQEQQLDGKAYTIYGRPGKAIVEVSEQTNASMIVMGSRGLGPIARKMIGSVSEYVITKSKVPVTVVPPPDKLDLLWYILH